MEVKREPEVKELDKKVVAYVSFTGNYQGNSEVFAKLFETLCGWAGPKGLIGKDSLFLSSYQDDPKVTPPEEMKVEVCMTIPENTEVEGEVKKQTLPGGKYVVMNVELNGPQEYGDAWMKIVEWMKENNKEIDMTKPSYEIYLNDPKEHPEGHHILDICMSTK
jgi:AraC family transcriptional regulator